MPLKVSGTLGHARNKALGVKAVFQSRMLDCIDLRINFQNFLGGDTSNPLVGWSDPCHNTAFVHVRGAETGPEDPTAARLII